MNAIAESVKMPILHTEHYSGPLAYKDHLSIETMTGWLIVHFSCIKAPLYKDHLSTETTITSSIEWSL